jgi:CubicO group peptidase (beta-lactamase class C family)
VEAGQVKLGDPVKKFLPAFNRAEPITLEHLLGHDSGLPAWLPLYEDIPPGEADYPKIRDRFIGRINGVALEAPLAAKRIYSDLGFILLGFILEAVAGRRLDEIFRKEIAEPLGLKRSCFNPCLPPTRISPQEIVSTEDCPRRKKLLSGEVHDDNAYALGGVAGHAGLFSSAPDLQGFVEFLWEAWEGKSSRLRRESLLEFIGEQRPRRLGWDTVSAGSSQAGKYFSAAALGHLAFTGCSLWLDPLNKKSVTLLTNRVHPSRENEAIKDFRPMIHDKILELTGLAG